MPKQTITAALEIGKRVKWTDEKGITRINRIMYFYENGTAALNHFSGYANLWAIVPVHSLTPVTNC